MILHGDCLDKLKTLPDNSVDAVVTDPPYGLAFMGKKWDYDVPSVAIWREVLRVLKPGGHLLSFGGTRTYHRMAVNIEDAGFEIRDQVQWLYGSGFPKSHNISKAIDKMAGVEREVIGSFKATGTARNSKHIGAKTHAAMGEYEADVDRIYQTAPATPEAKLWDGWGSALKPANEPICLARKPLEKGLTLAENVLKWGTGGLNIDGCRILPAGQLPAIKSPWENAEHLCDSCANNAESRTKLTARALKESTATKSAELISSENLKAPTDMITTDTGCFDGQSLVDQNENPNVNSSLNTDGFGKNQTAQCPVVTASTTLTKTKKTIDLKTCSLCESPIISNTTSQNTHQLKSEMQSTQGGHASAGRWPSNLLLDETAAAVLDEQSGNLGKSAGGNSKNVGNKIYGKYEAGLDKKPCGFGDSGGASRFFYVAKASKRERNAGLDGYEIISVEQDRCKEDLTVAVQLLQKVTSDDIALSKSDLSWSIDESGKNISAIFPKECKSTIKTETSKITQSEIWSLLIRLLIKENTQDVSTDLNLVASAESLKKFLLSITNEKMESALGAVNAASKTLQSISENEEQKNFSNFHSTVKPVKLMEYLITLITPPGGVVLDPFMGSGTTGVAATKLGKGFIGIEREREYVEIAMKRIEAV